MSAPIPARGDLIGPWQVSVDMLLETCPDVRLLDVADPDSQSPADTKPVSTASAVGFIQQISARISTGTWDMSRIRSDDPRQAVLLSSGTPVVVWGASSLLEAAAHPARSGINDNEYHVVLWRRFLESETKLEALVARWVAVQGDNVSPDPGAGTSLSYAFQPPVILDSQRF